MNNLSERRLAICRKCLLSRKSWDGSIRCDSSKFMSPDGTQVSYLPKKDWIRGCGCNITVASSNPNKECVANK
ncbi:MAG: hypothetical protein J6X03_02060 [Bacilli bacterium]|nr:hypothetical protein [Bacilli bacterium]